MSGSTFTGNTAGSGNGGLNNETGGLLTQFDNQFIDDQPPDDLAQEGDQGLLVPASETVTDK